MKIALRKSIALMACAAMIFGCTPTIAFAQEGDSASPAEMKQAVEDAQAALKTAQAELDAAEQDMETAKAERDAKQTAATEAENTAAEAEKGAASKESARDSAFESVKNTAKSERDAAQTSYDAAAGEYDEAVANLNDLNGKLQQAQQEKSDLNTEISELESEKAQAQNLVDTLPGQIEEAEAALETAKAKWEQDKKAADAAVEQAQKAYDEAGYDFINNKINALGDQYFDLDEMIEICKGYNDDRSKLKYPVTFNGKSISTIGDAVNDASFMDIVKSNCTKENLLFAMDMIDRSNEIREAENKSIFGVSYQLMGAAIMSNSITAYSTGHTLYNKNGKTPEGYANTDSFWAIGPATWGNENLYYSSGRIRTANEPYVGWYDEEKAAMQKAVDSGEYPGLTMETSTRDVWTNYPEVSGQAGHYLTLKNEEYTTTGLAVTYNTGSMPTSWRARAAQSFNDDTQNSISVDQCRNEINQAFAQTEADLDNATAARSALDSKPEAVTSAEQTITTKQNQLTEAQKALSENDQKISEKNTRLSEIDTDIEELNNKIPQAESTKNDKESAKDDAQTTLTEKETAYTNAQALDMNDPETYSDYPELVSAVRDAEEARSEASELRTKADDAAAEAETALDAYKTAKANYDTKKAAYDTAKSEYEKVSEAYEAATNIEMATITVPSQTYKGSALTPTPVVKLDGRTLVYETDFTTDYANNRNAGKASVTVKGTGDYHGEVTKNFTIKRAANKLKISPKTATVKYSKVKKKTQYLAVTNVIKFSNKGTGKLTYTKASGNKGITINKTSGKVTVKKKLKKGTYKINVKVKAAGNTNISSATKAVTFKVKVR